MIHGFANYANTIICISDHEIKGLCLSFYLVPILVVYDSSSCIIIDFVGTPPIIESIF